MDAGQAIAKHLAGLSYADLPPTVREAGKEFTLDALGVALAGSTAPGAAEVARLVRRWAGRPEATVWAFGGKVPAPPAALVNGMLVHARDFDDTHDVAGVHALAAVLPAALAVAETAGGVAGRDLITALVAGVDLAGRLGLSIRYYQGWHLTGICGVFGAAAAAAKILALDEDRVRHALGIALSQAAGSLQPLLDGALAKRLQPGLAAQAGVLSAFLAREGITGPREIFQGPYGFFALYDSPLAAPDVRRFTRQSDTGHVYGEEHLTRELGRTFEIANLSAKPYPCCRAAHGAAQAALACLEEEGVAADQVERAEARVPAWVANLVGRPFDPAANGALVAAQFSLPYILAAAIRWGDLFLDSFTADAIRDPEVLALARRIDVIVDPAAAHKVPVAVTLHLRDGRQVSRTVTRVKGEPGNPLSPQDLAAKFRRCAAWALHPLDPVRIDQVVGLIRGLEDVPDVRQIPALLT